MTLHNPGTLAQTTEYLVPILPCPKPSTPDKMVPVILAVANDVQ